MPGIPCSNSYPSRYGSSKRSISTSSAATGPSRTPAPPHFPSQRPFGKLRDFRSVEVALQYAFQHRPAASPKQTADHTTQLDVGVLKHFRQPVLLARIGATLALAPPLQIAQLSDIFRRNKARVDRSVPQKMRQPLAILAVRLVSTPVLHMRWLGQQHLEHVFQFKVYRLPISASTLHDCMQPSSIIQPAKSSIPRFVDGNLLLLTFGSSAARPVMTPTTNSRLPTSSPAPRSIIALIIPSLVSRESHLRWNPNIASRLVKTAFRGA